MGLAKRVPGEEDGGGFVLPGEPKSGRQQIMDEEARLLAGPLAGVCLPVLPLSRSSWAHEFGQPGLFSAPKLTDWYLGSSLLTRVRQSYCLLVHAPPARRCQVIQSPGFGGFVQSWVHFYDPLLQPGGLEITETTPLGTHQPPGVN